MPDARNRGFIIGQTRHARHLTAESNGKYAGGTCYGVSHTHTGGNMQIMRLRLGAESNCLDCLSECEKQLRNSTAHSTNAGFGRHPSQITHSYCPDAKNSSAQHGVSMASTFRCCGAGRVKWATTTVGYRKPRANKPQRTQCEPANTSQNKTNSRIDIILRSHTNHQS